MYINRNIYLIAVRIEQYSYTTCNTKKKPTKLLNANGNYSFKTIGNYTTHFLNMCTSQIVYKLCTSNKFYLAHSLTPFK